MPQNYRYIVYWPAALDAFCVRLIRHSLAVNYRLICRGNLPQFVNIEHFGGLLFHLFAVAVSEGILRMSNISIEALRGSLHA